MKIRIGTRGSRLALTQTKWVASQLKEKNPKLEIEIITIKTKGDKILNIALDKIGDKGLFVKEIESALLEGKIDCAVHSLKDMPSEDVEGLTFSKTPKREDRRDVLILAKDFKSLEDVPKGSVLGTGSKRRCFQITELRPDLTFEPVRGNIETRMNKIETQNMAGVILAAAGLHRLNLKERITVYLEENEFTPAPAQGALGIQHRFEDGDMKELLDSIGDEISENQVLAERSFMKHINGGCHAPVGAYATIKGDDLHLAALFGTNEGEFLVRGEISGKVSEGCALGETLANQLLEAVNAYER